MKQKRKDLQDKFLVEFSYWGNEEKNKQHEMTRYEMMSVFEKSLPFVVNREFKNCMIESGVLTTRIMRVYESNL